MDKTDEDHRKEIISAIKNTNLYNYMIAILESHREGPNKLDKPTVEVYLKVLGKFC